ncbi:hypothetical protein HGRIS_001819 [Hohenbuehelia grisea]|uniref:ABC transporter domain-containing protein n=1 Tax=Hohenbuehelia grisea TaxID=104357 RepID=A0ABR3JJA1_9AGAR
MTTMWLSKRRLDVAWPFCHRFYSTTISHPLIRVPKANVYRFGDSNNAPPILRDLDWTAHENEAWAVVGAASGEKTALFQTLLGHMRVAPPPPLGLFPLLSEQGRDPYQAVSVVSFGNRSRAAGGAFYDYSARYGAVREEDRVTLRESAFPEMIRDPALRPNLDDGTLRESASEDDIRYFEDLAEKLGLLQFLDLPLVALSNGQTRRARIIKAILSKPELLLLDEPLTGLDVQTRPSLLSLLHRLHSERKPRIILGLRTQDEIPEWITHVALVNDGSVHTGSKDEVRIPKARPKTSEKTGDGRPSSSHQTGKLVVDMNNVKVQYGDRIVLNDLSWQIKEGERWHLIGPNGSGKTTLLSLITGDHPQSYTQYTASSNSPSRHLRLFSQPRSRLPTPVIHSKIGVVSPELFDAFPRGSRMTVWEAIVTGFEGVFCVPRGAGSAHEQERRKSPVGSIVGGKVGEEMSSAERAWRLQRAWEVLACLGPDSWHGITLQDNNTPSEATRQFASRSFASLSTGEQRTVLLMRALVGRPPLVLLDEVWSGMDASMVRAARRYLRGEDTRAGVGVDQAVVVITHWEDEVPWRADEGVSQFVLEKGKGRIARTT